MQGKPNNNSKHLWFYLLYQNSYFPRKHSLKKVVYTITNYLQFLCVAGYFKRSNDTPKLNMHKYTTFNIIEIYINRLSTTTQVFIAMDQLILISKKYLHFKTKACDQEVFVPYCRSNWIHVLQVVSKLIIVVNLRISKLRSPH